MRKTELRHSPSTVFHIDFLEGLIPKKTNQKMKKVPRMFYKDDRIALLIDGVNLHGAAKALGFEINYKLLREEFMRRGKMLRASYYTCVSEQDDFLPLKPLTDWLQYNGFNVVTKTFREYTDPLGRKKKKGSIAVEIATDAMMVAPHVDHVVLFSGDGDFRALVSALQAQGCRVTVVSTTRSEPPMVSDDLRRQADNFIELSDLADLIARKRDD